MTAVLVHWIPLRPLSLYPYLPIRFKVTPDAPCNESHRSKGVFMRCK